MKLGKILVPLDGSTLAETALLKAVQVAEGATIGLLRAAEADVPPGPDSPQAQVAALREAQTYLKRVVEAARAQKVDLIVMATHGRSGLEHLVLGSVTESVLRGTPVPVLVIRPEDAPVGVPVGAGPAGEDFRV